MAALEDPEIDVKLIADGDVFRVTVEAAAVVLKFDLHDVNVMSLATECVAALLAEAGTHEGCAFCGPDGGLGEGETCEFVALHQLLGEYLRRGGQNHAPWRPGE